MEEKKTKNKKDLLRGTRTLKGNSKNRGITLIALVISIIVILILAGVAVATLTGDNGILNRAEHTKNTTEKSTEKEKIKVEIMGAYDLTGKLIASQLEYNLKNNIKDANTTATTKEDTGEKIFPVNVIFSNGHKYKVTKDGNINSVYEDGILTAVIPEEFSISEKSNEINIENGLVVKDSNQNEWVWVPVSIAELNNMYEQNETGWKMSGTDIVTQYRSIGMNRGNPGTGGAREPDVLNQNAWDKGETNLLVLGFNNMSEMANSLSEDYRNMIESIRENKGFYIGRYELSTEGIKKNCTPLTSGNWYTLYQKCKNFSNNKVETRMIWGCTWEQICRFINEHGDMVNLDDSTSYGNYKGQLQKTGYRKTNNIYDLAGNCWEWSQENNTTYRRAFRGGGNSTEDTEISVLARSWVAIGNLRGYATSRPVLYIK